MEPFYNHQPSGLTLSTLHVSGKDFSHSLKFLRFHEAGLNSNLIMPRHCSAGGCKSRDTRESRKAGVTFHKLPKGKARRNLWINQSHRDGLWEPQTDFVYFCSKHFTPESFELIGYSGIRRIREDAYPTLFEATPEIKRKGRPRKQTNSTKAEPTSQEGSREETQEAQNDQEEEAQNVPSSNGSEPDPAMETDTNTTSSSQAPGPPEEAEDSSQQQGSASPSSPRPVSPSRYMRRLPPPPGFHLPKEHNYAQICPLVWRRRYDRVIDCLEKALRQLNAARRRENRLRVSLLRLREKRLKHTLLLPRDRSRGRAGRTPPRALFRGDAEERLSSPTNPDENDTDAEAEDNGLLAGELGEAADSGGWTPATDTRRGSEEGPSSILCFYCGRGREDSGGHAAPRGSATSRGAPTVNKRDAECDKRATIPKRPERKFRKKLATENEAEDDDDDDRRHPRGAPIKPKRKIQSPVGQCGSSQPPSPAAPLQQSQAHVDLQQMISEGAVHQPGPSSHGTFLSETSGVEHAGPENQENFQQQQQQLVCWIEESTEGQLLLIPFPDDGRTVNLVHSEGGVAEDLQAIVVSENFSREVRVAMASDDAQASQQGVPGAPVVMREDVKEKLKEHLEGFQLQLSNEFID